MEKKGTIVVIVGATGVGKTALSIQLAQFLKAPIVSADSRQIYKELPIGTAAPTINELAQVKHFNIANHSVDDYYSAAQFEADTLLLLDSLFLTVDYVVVTGGSMLYVDALCNGIDVLPTVDEVTRQYYADRYKKEGLDNLLNELKIWDPVYYNEVDQRNYKRIIHALEICSITHQPYSTLRTKTIKQRDFNIIKIGIDRPRQELYERINKRVDTMMAMGLEKEVESLLPKRTLNALNTVGYKELFDYFDGHCDLTFAVEKIKQHTRIYARKQLTWFKKDHTIQWFYPDDTKNILKYLREQI